MKMHGLTTPKFTSSLSVMLCPWTYLAVSTE